MVSCGDFCIFVKEIEINIIMENRISTTYVPLNPPYQIIKYSGAIAMQIGTLIVILQKKINNDGKEYEIETHSHPVVVYENKANIAVDIQLSNYSFMEGAVWNHVEVKDITTICLSNSKLSWEEFVAFLQKDVIRRTPTIALTSPAAYWFINNLCKGIDRPYEGEYVIHIEERPAEKDYEWPHLVLRSRPGDLLALNASLESLDIAKSMLNTELTNYSYVLRNGRQPTKNFIITFSTEDSRFHDIIQYLNEQMTYRYLLWSGAADEDMVSRAEEIVQTLYNNQ